jgi:hypothetical protein
MLSSHPGRAAGILLGACMGGSMFGGDMNPEQRVFFENKIRPVLVKQCYECHSAGAKKLGGKLLLDAPSEMIAGGESGPALVPGLPDESLIIRALRYQDPEMPPKKRLSDPVIEDFVTWVKMGAPDPRADVPKTAGRPVATDKAALWSFQPVTRPQPPAVTAIQWPHDAIDAFVLSKLEAKGLSPARDAEPAALIRRLHFDLIGLPAKADEIAGFVSDWRSDSSLAARQLLVRQAVERLLQNPHFGERWGRHWLDVARYGESNGNDGLSRNPSYPHAWRYRDYVIRSLNDDTPYDRFVTEQVAGDLLPADSPAQRDRQLIATGFLAIGAKPAKAMNDNFEMDVVADQIGVIGSGIMGLSVGCARCHDHKHDPITARDYYALAGIFRSTETMWGAAALQGLTAPQTPLHELQAAPRVSPRPELEEMILAHRPHKPPAKPSFPHSPGAPLAMGLRDARKIEDCRLNIDGDAKKLGASVPRGFVAACSAGDSSAMVDAGQSGRLQLAHWLVSPRHPQTPRVIVNRVWQHLFGEGLVRTPDDFGAYGDRPSNPGLLDHLASRFMAEGWSIKRLIRNIVLSHTYQLDSECDAALRNADPENLLLGRQNRRRLDAEALRDAMLSAAGGLDESWGRGSLIQERDVLINELGELHRPSNHRSIYLLMLRNSMPPELTPFNLPDALAVAGKRDDSTLATQSLYLLNNAYVVEQSRRLAGRVARGAVEDPARVRLAYLSALGREPGAAEAERALDFVRAADLMLVSGGHAEESRLDSAWAALCHALLASNEFRYVD